MNIAQINVVATLSTGRIAATLSRMAIARGHRAVFCYSRDKAANDIPSIYIGNRLDTFMHASLTRLTDRAGFYSKAATQKLVEDLKAFQPDIIHLHNIHGYYLHLPTLFEYICQHDIPVVWTLHDCWAYTGHCAYYTMAVGAPPISGIKRRSRANIGCDRWLAGCGECVLKHTYPSSLLRDQSSRNWQDKRRIFTQVPHMVLTTPSIWLKNEVKRSFLSKYPVYALPNGIDLEMFKPCVNENYSDFTLKNYKLDKIGGKHLIISVAAVWDERKGLRDLMELAQMLGDRYCVIAVGLDENQIKALPNNSVIGLPRTKNVDELCVLYTAAEVYVTMSREETMGMTLVEALACGTQVLCYDATALPEIVTPQVGEVVKVGDVTGAANQVRLMCASPKDPAQCRQRAQDFESHKRFEAYMQLYKKIYRNTPAYLKTIEKAKYQS